MLITKYETNQLAFKYMKKTENLKLNTDLGNIEKDLIILYPEFTHQEILGFGGAFTESAGYCFSQLPDDKKQKFINDYFSSDGNNYSFCRTPIGSCDFSLSMYSYSGKEDLSDFSVARDTQYIIPLIKNVLEHKPYLRIIATPWSPPSFMKSTNKLQRGGKILDEFKNTWAEYLVKYIKEYEKNGININFITIQNEPNASQPWESCEYTAEEELEMIKNHIVPTFKKYHLNTKLLIWDHNKERIVYRSQEIFSDSDVKNAVAGIGYHYYSGDYFENIELFHTMYPNKLAIHTEGCTGYELLWFRKHKRNIPNAEIYARDIIGDLNAGSNAYIDWNLLLDYKGGPTHVYNACNAPIMLDRRGTNYTKSLSYYYIGHFSRFILPGAHRISYSKYTNELDVTAFINPDKSIVAVILNRGNLPKHFNMCVDKKIYSDIVWGHSIITLVIK